MVLCVAHGCCLTWPSRRCAQVLGIWLMETRTIDILSSVITNSNLIRRNRYDRRSGEECSQDHERLNEPGRLVVEWATGHQSFVCSAWLSAPYWLFLLPEPSRCDRLSRPRLRSAHEVYSAASRIQRSVAMHARGDRVAMATLLPWQLRHTEVWAQQARRAATCLLTAIRSSSKDRAARVNHSDGARVGAGTLPNPPRGSGPSSPPDARSQ